MDDQWRTILKCILRGYAGFLKSTFYAHNCTSTVHTKTQSPKLTSHKVQRLIPFPIQTPKHKELDSLDNILTISL